MLVVSDNRKNKISRITTTQYCDIFEHFGEGTKDPKVDEIYLLNHDNKNAFIGKSNNQLFALYKGKKKKLNNRDIEFYFEKLKQTDNKHYAIYRKYLEQICEELSSIGVDINTRDIHGVIIDIGYNYHLYISPISYNITAYYANNTKSFILFNTINECFSFWQRFVMFDMHDKSDSACIDNEDDELDYLISEKEYIDNIISRYENVQSKLNILASKFNQQTELDDENFTKIYGETQIYKQKEFTSNTNIFILND